MKNYLEKLVNAGILSIIQQDFEEIKYNVESDYYMITNSDYMYSGKNFIVDNIIYRPYHDVTNCFNIDNQSLAEFETIEPNLFHICKILDI